MKKNEIINEVLRNGYWLSEATDYGMLAFEKTSIFGDDEVRTRIEVTNMDEMSEEYKLVCIFRRLVTKDEKNHKTVVKTIQEMVADFQHIVIDGKAVSSTRNYTSIVL